MNVDPSAPISPKPNPLRWVLAGLGCALVALAGVVILGWSVMRTAHNHGKPVPREELSDPRVQAAVIILKQYPEQEVVGTDALSGQITVRNRKTHAVLDVNSGEILSGRFPPKTVETEKDAVKPAPVEDLPITMKGPDGQKLVGGDPEATAPPSWVPSYPAGQAQAGGSRQETKDGVTGTWLARTSDAPSKIQEYYESTLQADGFATETSASNADGNDSVVIKATSRNGKRKMTITAGTSNGITNVVITYESTK